MLTCLTLCLAFHVAPAKIEIYDMFPNQCGKMQANVSVQISSIAYPDGSIIIQTNSAIGQRRANRYYRIPEIYVGDQTYTAESLCTMGREQSSNLLGNCEYYYEEVDGRHEFEKILKGFRNVLMTSDDVKKFNDMFE